MENKCIDCIYSQDQETKSILKVERPSLGWVCKNPTLCEYDPYNYYLHIPTGYVNCVHKRTNNLKLPPLTKEELEIIL